MLALQPVPAKCRIGYVPLQKPLALLILQWTRIIRNYYSYEPNAAAPASATA
jgi:hypothetical protein